MLCWTASVEEIGIAVFCLQATVCPWTAWDTRGRFPTRTTTVTRKMSLREINLWPFGMERVPADWAIINLVRSERLAMLSSGGRVTARVVVFCICAWAVVVNTDPTNVRRGLILAELEWRSRKPENRRHLLIPATVETEQHKSSDEEEINYSNQTIL